MGYDQNICTPMLYIHGINKKRQMIIWMVFINDNHVAILHVREQ